MGGLFLSADGRFIAFSSEHLEAFWQSRRCICKCKAQSSDSFSPHYTLTEQSSVFVISETCVLSACLLYHSVWKFCQFCWQRTQWACVLPALSHPAALYSAVLTTESEWVLAGRYSAEPNTVRAADRAQENCCGNWKYWHIQICEGQLSELTRLYLFLKGLFACIHECVTCTYV